MEENAEKAALICSPVKRGELFIPHGNEGSGILHFAIWLICTAGQTLCLLFKDSPVD